MIVKISSTYKYIRTSLLLTFSFLWISLVTGQYDDLRFQRYSVLDGMSQCYVNSINQDNKGFIWIGTHKGLNRFDGYHFKKYLAGSYSSDSHGSHMMKGIFEDSRNRLWVGSYSGNGGLFLYDRKLDRFISMFDSSDFCLTRNDNRVYSIVEDKSGNLWLGTSVGLARFNPNEKDPDLIVYKNKEGDPSSLVSDRIGNLFIDSHDRLWISTMNGLDLFDKDNERFIHFGYNAREPFSLGHNTILEVIEDQFGTLWVATQGGGLNKMVITTQHIQSNNDVRFIRYQYDPDNQAGISNDIVNSFRAAKIYTTVERTTHSKMKA